VRISVLSHPGERGRYRPCAFHLGGRRLQVVTVLDSWTDSAHWYFEVSVQDGRRFILRHEQASNAWELAAVYAASAPAPRPAASASFSGQGRIPLPAK